MNISQYTIHELSTLTDNRFWKLHWFEALTTNQQTREPLIEARFVPLIRTDLKLNHNPPQLLYNFSYDFSQSKKIEVGGGQLSMLHIGLMFHQGRPVERPGYQRMIFDLFIEDRTTRVLPVNKSYKTGRRRWAYYIPFDQYYLDGTNLFTRCLHIDVSQKRPDGISKVIVPCAEVIRHHYGNSSELFREILTDGLAGKPNRVFNENKTIMPGSGNVPFVQLSKYVKDEDAPIIARFAFSPYAFANAKHIYISAQNNFRRPHQGRLPEATLPYINQQTRLIVHGKTIRSGAERYFLVYYIEKDYAPFPFDYFEYDRDNSGTHVVEDESLPVSGWQKREQGEDVITVQSEIEEQIIRSDKEPSPIKDQVEEILLADKFPDLKKKDWQKRQKPCSHTRTGDKQVGFIQGHDDTEELSTAPAGHGNTKVTSLSISNDLHSGEGAKLVPVMEATSDTESPVPENTPQEPSPRQVNQHGKALPALPASYDLFSDLVHRLNLVKPGELSCEIVELAESGPAISHVALSSFPTKWKGKPLPWSKVFRGSEHRARYVLAARGRCHRSHYFYLLEIEPPESDEGSTYTMLVLHSDDDGFPDLEGEDLQKVLAHCAINRGSWLKDDELEFGRRKIKHASKVRRRYVFRIVEFLIQAGLLRMERSELAALSKDSKLSKVGKLSSTIQATERVEESGESPKAGETDKEYSQIAEDSRMTQAEELIVADAPTEASVSSGAYESSETGEQNETDESEALILL